MKRAHRGFTLIELLFVVTLIGIMIAIAVPSFASFISSYRATADVNDLLEAITLTRSEALKRGRTVTLMPNDTNKRPSKSGSWANGWTVFVHSKTNDATSTYATIAFPPDTMVAQHDPLPASTVVTATDSATSPFGSAYVTFDGSGYAHDPATGATISGGIVFTDKVGASTNIRTLCLALFGRPRIIKPPAVSTCVSG